MAIKTAPKTILPPNCIDTEMAVLGGLITANELIPRIKAYLTPDAFYLGKNKVIYEAILYLHSKRKSVDIVMLNKYIEDNGQLNDIGGPGYISDLILTCPNPYRAESYAEEVQADYAKRQLIDIGSWITKEAYNANGNLPELIGGGRRKIQMANRLITNDSHTLNLKTSNQFYLDLLDRRSANKDNPKLKFPWPGFNRLMPELGYGELVSILAEPGVGKTVFLENCAEAWAKQGWKVLFFHLELNEQTMFDRRMNRQSGIPLRLLREPERLDEKHWQSIFEAVTDIEAWSGDIHYIHCPGWTANKIIAKAIELDESHGIDVLIVDYFNKIRTETTNGMNYSQARGLDIETLKIALEEYNWRGLMAAQFDKSARGKQNKRGSDARDTAELEDKSNVVIVIDRRLGENNKREPFSQFQIVKCNAGEEGSIDTFFKGDRYQFVELEVKRERLEY